ncbi:cilia- and flagella-associated protein 410 [Thamnophis elegans]|uniref:cilia- and flagella-associated protein 410 n=1 Tax=Thamnophis elegans TaxID=35005 RepID=UPI0013778D98|nr:cilia- and flagella-associated protein 410 [Thamnophis elegans]
MEMMAPAPGVVVGNASEVPKPTLAKRPEKSDGCAETMKLTRKAVLSRAKATSLAGVRKLNCWGTRISDISICHQLPNVEVVTFSANNIYSLEPFNQCEKLTELYLRRNCISNLHELFHLKKLPRLRILWMSENPCCGSDHHRYRMTVLRNLPSLQKLDNKMVTEEELSHALVQGEEITAPPVTTDVDSCCQYSNTESSTTECTTENELMNISTELEETNKIRKQLGMKPVVPKDTFSPKEVDGTRPRWNNILNAIMLLLEELDSEGLEVIHQTVGNKLQALQKKELHEDR